MLTFLLAIGKQMRLQILLRGRPHLTLFYLTLEVFSSRLNKQNPETGLFMQSSFLESSSASHPFLLFAVAVYLIND